MQILEALLITVVIEVLAAIIAHPIIEFLAAKFRGRQAGNAGLTTWALDWSEWLFFITVMIGLTGAAAISLGVSRALFGFLVPERWHLPAVVVAWLIYMALSFLVGFSALQWLHMARDGLTRKRSRQRLFHGAVWAKTAILVFCLGWALIRLPGSLYEPLLVSYLLFVAADAVAFIAILLIV